MVFQQEAMVNLQNISALHVEAILHLKENPLGLIS